MDNFIFDALIKKLYYYIIKNEYLLFCYLKKL